MSYAIIAVGATGTGKTYWTKQQIKNVNKNALLVFDVNSEYTDVFPYPFDADMDNFLTKCEKVTNAVILIEDATSFFSVQGRSDRLIKILIAKRHTKNTIVLLFHSWGDVPTYIYRKCTHVAQFKTFDHRKHVERLGNQQILEVWERVQKQCEGHKFWSSYPPPKGVAPPFEVCKLY